MTDNELTRRETIRKGAVSATGLALGGATLSGEVTGGPTGGTATTVNRTYHRNVPFTVLERYFDDLSFRVSCHAADAERKNMFGFTLKYDNGVRTSIIVLENKGELIEVGDRFEFTTNDPQICKERDPDLVPDLIKVAFKPVK